MLRYSRVPSKRVAMVSKKVFCGAIRPRITGILERVEPRLSRPWLSPAVETNPGRNLDEAPGAPPNPCRRAPRRDTRDSMVQQIPSTTECGEEERREEEPLLGRGWREPGVDGHIYARPPPPPIALLHFSLFLFPGPLSLCNFISLFTPHPLKIWWKTMYTHTHT